MGGTTKNRSMRRQGPVGKPRTSYEDIVDATFLRADWTVPQKRVRIIPARVQFAPQLQSDNALGCWTDVLGLSG